MFIYPVKTPQVKVLLSCPIKVLVSSTLATTSTMALNYHLVTEFSWQETTHFTITWLWSALYSGLVSKNDKRTTTTESAFLVLSKGSNLANKEEDS